MKHPVRRIAAAALPAFATVVAGNATAVPAQAASQRLTFDTVTTADHYQGLVRATGHLSSAPGEGTAVYLQRYVPSAGAWRDVGIGYTTAAR